MAIHNRHNFHAFSALRWSDFRPATFGHNERRIDEAFFFIQRAVFTKLVGNVRQNQTQNLVAAPSLKASMPVVRIALRQHVAAMLQKTNAVAVRTIGIDTGKNTLHLIGLDQQGTIVLREKLARGRIGRRLANASPCLIGIEAGMATHYVARELLALGHDVRQVPPAYAKPFRQGHKNDFRDAYAIAEGSAAAIDTLRSSKN